MTKTAIERDEVTEDEQSSEPDFRIGDDTCLIPWPDFIFKAMRRHKQYAIAYGSSAFLMFYLIWTNLSLFLGVLVIPLLFMAIGALTFGFGILLDRKLTRPVVNYRLDSAGLPTEDWQRWWVEDALAWPDIYKRDFEGQRVLWIDTLDEDNPIAFNPWIAALPKRDEKGHIPVTGTRVAAVAATSKSVSNISRHRPRKKGESLQQGLMVGLALAGLVAILMGADRIAMLMGYTV